MSETINFARMYTAQLNEALSQLPEDGFEEINRVLQDARETGRQVFVVGNGGSRERLRQRQQHQGCQHPAAIAEDRARCPS